MSLNLILKELDDGTFLVGTDTKTTTWNAFENPDNINENLEIPSTVTIIGQFAFFNCKKIKTISLPDTIKEIRYSAFDKCSLSIETLKLPSSLVYLGLYAFADNDIKHVIINNKLQTIIGDPFGVNMNLEDIQVPIDNYYFANDSQGALYNKNYDTLYQVPCAPSSFLIPHSVTHIEIKAFDRSAATEITLPETILSFSETCFYSCHSLKIIHIYCTCLTNVIFRSPSALQEVFYYRKEIVDKNIFIYPPEKLNIYLCDQYSLDTFSNFPVTSKIGICLIISKITCQECINSASRITFFTFNIFIQLR